MEQKTIRLYFIFLDWRCRRVVFHSNGMSLNRVRDVFDFVPEIPSSVAVKRVLENKRDTLIRVK